MWLANVSQSAHAHGLSYDLERGLLGDKQDLCSRGDFTNPIGHFYSIQPRETNI